MKLLSHYILEKKKFKFYSTFNMYARNMSKACARPPRGQVRHVTSRGFSLIVTTIFVMTYVTLLEVTRRLIQAFRIIIISKHKIMQEI